MIQRDILNGSNNKRISYPESLFKCGSKAIREFLCLFLAEILEIMRRMP